MVELIFLTFLLRMKMRNYLMLFFLLIATFAIKAQVTDSIASRVVLDTEVIVAAKRGFSVKRFIDIVQKDTVFEQAFSRLRKVAYTSSNDFHFYSKRGKEKATYQSELQQIQEDSCVEMTLLSEQSTGNYYKRKKKHRYYTAKMFERLFYKKGRHCTSSTPPKVATKKSRMENYVQQLKKLIYNPGKEVDIPFIGHKTAIFDKKMIQYYNFKIQSRRYQDDTPCYVFIASAKPNHSSGKTVIKYLEMWMDKSDLGIISKKYHLKTSNLFFNFDIKMDVDLLLTQKGVVPSRIEYDGAWKAPTKRKEIADFLLEFVY